VIGDTSIRVDELSQGINDMWLTLVAPPPTQDGLDKYVCLSPLILLTSPSSYVARLHADNL
jgi:hypothetical protein